ncbi:MAG TPA: hypothetical protein VGM51_13665 [Armatimonadota bacterium]|jgi:hypothetical protein
MHRSFTDFPGIVDDPVRLGSLNSLINAIHKAGFDRLVQNVITRSGEAAMDVLLEAGVCCELLANESITNVEYEPDTESRPPDFRCFADGTRLDIQVKRLRSLESRDAKDHFQRRCEARLQFISMPWLLHYWLSDRIQRQDADRFLTHLKAEVGSLCPAPPTHDLDILSYCWPDPVNPIVKYGVSECSRLSHMEVGVIDAYSASNGLMREINTAVRRKAVHTDLSKAGKTFTRPPGRSQVNLVVLQAVWELMIRPETMANVLYGDEVFTFDRLRPGGGGIAHRQTNGLFRSGKSSRISGLVMVPHSWDWSCCRLRGTLYVHPDNAPSVWSAMQVFPDLQCYLPPGWKVSDQLDLPAATEEKGNSASREE